MNRRHFGAILALSPLVGCAALVTELSSSQAQELWGIAKGVGLEALKVASLDPDVSAAITAAIAIADAASDAETLITQAHAVLLAAAPAVTVVANS